MPDHGAVGGWSGIADHTISGSGDLTLDAGTTLLFVGITTVPSGATARPYGSLTRYSGVGTIVFTSSINGADRATGTYPVEWPEQVVLLPLRHENKIHYRILPGWVVRVTTMAVAY